MDKEKRLRRIWREKKCVFCILKPNDNGYLMCLWAQLSNNNIIMMKSKNIKRKFLNVWVHWNIRGERKWGRGEWTVSVFELLSYILSFLRTIIYRYSDNIINKITKPNTTRYPIHLSFRPSNTHTHTETSFSKLRNRFKFVCI